MYTFSLHMSSAITAMSQAMPILYTLRHCSFHFKLRLETSMLYHKAAEVSSP